MARIHNLLLTSIVLLVQACASPEPRAEEQFRAISRANLERSSAQELSGLDPVKDWGPLLWLERALGAPDQRRHPLFLQGVTGLRGDELAILLAMESGPIYLPDLRGLEADLVQVFAGRTSRGPQHRGKELHLDGLRRLDLWAARALVGYRPALLSLGGLRAIEVEVATALAATSGALHLNGIAELSPESARALAAWEGWGEQVFLALRGLRRLDETIATELAACTGWGLDLSGLESLSPAAARALGKLDNPYLALDGLTELDLATAGLIASWHRKFLSLDGLKTLTPELRSLIEQGTEAVSLRSLLP